ncbi:sialoadhesin-like [Myripristis murdjan]|uniref:sialoadhesin-like n=1 Tax=Myripristis murdjan TaxID=586833 RepID=UPI001175EE31|nr:sialoadhesin-like [Myripristis murdjan]
MSFTAAACGFVVFLLSVPVVQGLDGWAATYTPTKICALKGSAVEMQCTYTYPYSENGNVTTVEKTLWFTKVEDNEPVNLRSDSEYEGRVEYYSEQKYNRLRISDLRESDSAVYKFRFITNQPGGKMTASPGVSLTVTDLQVKVLRSSVLQFYTEAELKCRSFCRLVGHLSFVCSDADPPVDEYTWYKENQALLQGPEGSYNFTSISSEDTGTYHCQSENQHGWINSPSVLLDVQYAPKVPSVSVSPSGEIVEGSSATLTCSSDANPAATYTWYKKNETSLKALGQTFTITNITSEHSGEYYCEVQNRRGRHNSTLQLTVVTVGAGRVMNMNVLLVTLLLLIPLTPCVLYLWLRRKKTVNGTAEKSDAVQTVQSDSDPVFEIVTAAQTEATEEQKEQEDQV